MRTYIRTYIRANFFNGVHVLSFTFAVVSVCASMCVYDGGMCVHVSVCLHLCLPQCPRVCVCVCVRARVCVSLHPMLADPDFGVIPENLHTYIIAYMHTQTQIPLSKATHHFL